MRYFLKSPSNNFADKFPFRFSTCICILPPSNSKMQTYGPDSQMTRFTPPYGIAARLVSRAILNKTINKTKWYLKSKK